MPPRIILKLIDTAILPSLLVFSIKFVSLILLSFLWQIPFVLSADGLIFNNSVDLYTVNNVSNLIQLGLTLLGLSLALIRLTSLTSGALKPSLLAKIVSARLESFITSLREAYVTAAVWLILTSTVTISLLIQAVVATSSFSVFALSASLLVLGCFVLLLCLDRDLHPSAQGGSVTIVEETLDA